MNAPLSTREFGLKSLEYSEFEDKEIYFKYKKLEKHRKIRKKQILERWFICMGDE